MTYTVTGYNSNSNKFIAVIQLKIISKIVYAIKLPLHPLLVLVSRYVYSLKFMYKAIKI